MDVTEKWGDDVDSAVELALTDLKATRDEVEITVLEEPSKGFLGIGAKLALVRVEKKSAKKDGGRNKSEEVNTTRPAESGLAKFEKEEKANDRSAEDEYIPSLEELDFRKTMGNLPITEDHVALTFLKNVAEQMGLDLKMVARADDENVYVAIEGDDSGTIIGKRGQTLDAIQYLTSLVVNKDKNDYVKVVVDAENYRSKREKTLEHLANKLANKVERTGKMVRLEPMNPYERKVIHATLQKNDKVTTRSEGQDPYRRVIVELK